jgi:hypothetical protein
MNKAVLKHGKTIHASVNGAAVFSIRKHNGRIAAQVLVMNPIREPQMITFNKVLKLLKQDKAVELKFYLVAGLFSRHELSLEDGKIQDLSYVDSSITTYTIKQYKRSFHGKAFKKHAVELSEII